MADVIFPYQTLTTQPEIVLSAPVVDGNPRQILAREAHIDLFAAPKDWREARVNIRVIVPMEELTAIGASEVHVVATIHCGPTNLRAVHRLEPSGTGGQWTGE